MSGVMGGLEGTEDCVQIVYIAVTHALLSHSGSLDTCNKLCPLSGDWGFLCSVGAHILSSAKTEPREKMEPSSLGGRGLCPFILLWEGACLSWY